MKKKQVWKTDPKFVINPEDNFDLHPNDIQKTSKIWKLKVGDKLSYKDFTGLYKGKVIGFNNYPQKGWTMFVETKSGFYIYLDAFTHEGTIENVE